MREPILELDQIQGISFPGFRKSRQNFLFFEFDDPESAREFIRKTGQETTSARTALEAHMLWKASADRGQRRSIDFTLVALALSASGLRKILVHDEVADFADKPFRLGMGVRSELLGDPASKEAEGHVANWRVGGAKRIDALIVVAADDEEVLSARSNLLEQRAAALGVRLIHRDRGRHRDDLPGHEQFGFADGISSPALRGMRADSPEEFAVKRQWPADPAFDELRLDFAIPGRRLIWPGHVYFGYARQRRGQPRVASEQNRPKGPSWAQNGTFLVYRRLRQDVSAFESFVTQISTQFGLKEEFFSSRLVGRWKSGTAISRSPLTDIAHKEKFNNYFSFAAESSVPLPDDPLAPTSPDPFGRACPFGAHVRKVNPRDEFTDLGVAAHTVAKLMLRRGITFDEGPDNRGLLFVAFMSSIRSQFEFLTTDWINRENQPRTHGGRDPILAQGEAAKFSFVANGTEHTVDVPGNWVIPTGGEYLFVPQKAFFDSNSPLAGGAKR